MTDDEEFLLDDLLSLESGLSSWEMDFIEALNSVRDGMITESQYEKLLEIWERTHEVQ